MSANALPTLPTAPMLTAPPSPHAEATHVSLPWLPPGEHLVLSGISWQQYVAISDALEGRHVRVTFDRGTLEIMALSRLHERISALLNLLVVQLLLETRTRFDTGGSMTFRREDLERGFEPDNCYWIQHCAQVHGRDVLDFHTDPPPDLALEAEVSRTIIARLGIYAALAVPEVWRCDGQTLRVLLRGEDGEYHVSQRSLAFPYLPVGELMRFVAMRDTTDVMQILLAFQHWVREQIVANWGQVTG